MIYTSALTANKLFTHLFFQIWILMCTVPINLDEMVRFNISGLGRAVEFSRTPPTMVSSETTCRRWRQVRSTLLFVFKMTEGASFWLQGRGFRRRTIAQQLYQQCCPGGCSAHAVSYRDAVLMLSSNVLCQRYQSYGCLPFEMKIFAQALAQFGAFNRPFL